MRSISTGPNARTTEVVRAYRRVAWIIAASALLLTALAASAASADATICAPGASAGQCERPEGIATDFETGRLYVADQLNNRVDVFESDGSFAFAFGWGVANGAAELQSCGPAANPSTAQCRAGLAGAGAGEFPERGLVEVVVDNDPSSASHHDIYTLDSNSSAFSGGGYRVQKFDSEGHFLLTIGGGVITGGAKGSGNLSAGSTEVSGVQTTSKTFELGQTIESPGKIPAETKIVAVGNGTITLSKPSLASQTAAPLSVAEGPGNVPTNELDTLVNTADSNGPPNFEFKTPNPSPSRAELGSNIPNSTDAKELQEALEALPNIGKGNVAVLGEKVESLPGVTRHEYTVEFKGTRFSDTNVYIDGSTGGGNREVLITENGGGAAEVCTAAIAASCTGGVEGRGYGQFGVRAHIAVGPGGDLYVVDCLPNRSSGNCSNRLQKFQPSGAFIEEIEIALPPGSGSNGLTVDANGDFYVSSNGTIGKFDSAGNLIGRLPATEEIGALAVDSSGDLFATERDGPGGGVIGEYDNTGKALRRFGYGVVQGAGGVAPSSTNGVYVSQGGNGLGTSGVVLYSFPPPGPQVAPQPCKVEEIGNAEVTLVAEANPEGQETKARFEYITAADYQENGNSFKGAHPASATVETAPASLRSQVTLEKEIKELEKEIENESGIAKEKDEARLKEKEERLTQVKEASPFRLHEFIGEAAVEPETEYRCRVVVTNADGSVTGEEGAFTTLKAIEIGASFASEVGAEEATLNAQIDPLGISTSGYFEYVEEATYLKDIEELGPEHGFDHALKAPDPATEEEIEFGGGKGFTTGSQTIKGLKLATSYRFRIHATNIFFELKGETGVIGPVARFRTYGASFEPLPDNRAWELVSPGEKNSAEVAIPGPAAGFADERTVRIQASATDGNSATYTSWTSFGKPEGAPWASQYLSKRTPEGWQTENISPYGFLQNLLIPPYSGFTPDLRFAAFKMTEPTLVEGCRKPSPGRLPERMYLRDNETGELRCLDLDVEGGPQGAPCLVYAGSSEDGSRSFIAGPPEGGEGFTYSLYESTADGVQPISVFPNGEMAPATQGTAFGAVYGGIENCQVTRSVLRHAISADGSRAFWTYMPKAFVPGGSGEPTRLFVRVNGTETLQLDAHQSGAGTESGEGRFSGASTDGSVAYFTDTRKLLKGSNPAPSSPDLYRYELGQPTPLTDLTKGSGPGQVKGVVGISDDGSYVYFVAGAVLTGEEEDEAGEKAKEGASNLYLFHEGQTRFIARLSDKVGEADGGDWASNPRELSARVSPDGKHLAFLSHDTQALAGYDNTVATGEHCQYSLEGEGSKIKLLDGPLCAQAFVYDAEDGKLTCASCNPSGARPQGPAHFPGWTNPFEGPRFLSEDGKQLFFESLDTLSAADENTKSDIYEFEQAGSGSCSEESHAYDSASGGCHFLISSGKSEDDSYLVDASASGRDVFFSTRQPLTGWDTNENYDVYDAREGGGFPEPSQAEPCQGEACKPAAVAPPATGSPTTPNFRGQGNPPPEKTKGYKPKPRHKHHNKKAKKKGHGKAKSKGRAAR